MAKTKLDRALLAANWAKVVGPLDKQTGLGSELKRLDDLNDDTDEDLFELKGISTRAEIEARLDKIDAAGDYARILVAVADEARTDLKSLLAKIEKAELENEPSGEFSGPKWVAKFPGGRSTSALSSSFGTKVDNFIAAIKSAGGAVTIAATFRPLKRAFLMHYSCRIAKQKFDPAKVPKYTGIDINWVHPAAADSINAADQMRKGYDIVYPPAPKSNHTARRAIDMTIRGIIGKTMKDAEGNDVAIKRDKDLHKVGATYGVKKLVKDKPHWSEDGH
jgi:hypothetical protein